MKIGERIKKLRQEQGVTQEGLAAAIHVSRSAIAKWESGRGEPTKESLDAICEYFSVTKEGFFDKTGSEKKEWLGKKLIICIVTTILVVFATIPNILSKEEKPTAEELKQLTPKVTQLYTVPKSGLIEEGLQLEGKKYILSLNEWNKIYFDVEMDERLVVSWFEYSIEFYDCELFMIEKISSHEKNAKVTIQSYCAYIRPQNQEVSSIKVSKLHFSYVYEGIRYEKECLTEANELSIKVKAI